MLNELHIENIAVIERADISFTAGLNVLTGETVTPEEEIYDNSAFSVAGPVTDNRDGTVTVKMGKITDREALEELLEVLG